MGYKRKVTRFWVTRRKTMKRVIEIRSAEGGADSQLFVKDLSAAYARMFARKG